MRERRLKNEINVVPYIDVMLVLLVIFILMTTASVQGMSINLPKPSAKPSTEKHEVKIIQIMPDGAIRLNGADFLERPELARRLTRPQDRVLLNEKHPEDGVLLKDNMKGDRRVKVHLGEGWHVPRALLPVAEKRAVMLIDPPFEKLDEMQRCAASLKEAVSRMRQTVAAIWYPVKDQRMLRRFYQDLAGTGAPKLLRVELLVHPLDTPNTLTGSGLAIANPPWGLEAELLEWLPWLATQLAQSQGSWQLDWVIEEKKPA